MAEGKVEKGPVGFVRLTESSATYLGTGPASYLGRQWTKLTGGVIRNMAVEHERGELEALWRDFKRENSEDPVLQQRFLQLDTAMRKSGWKPSAQTLSPPPVVFPAASSASAPQSPAPAASPAAPSASVTPHPSVPGPLPQPSTPQPQAKTPDPQKPESPKTRGRANSH